MVKLMISSRREFAGADLALHKYLFQVIFFTFSTGLAQFTRRYLVIFPENPRNLRRYQALFADLYLN